MGVKIIFTKLSLPIREIHNLPQLCNRIWVFCMTGDMLASIIFSRPGVNLMPKYVNPSGIHLNFQFFLISGGHIFNNGMASDFDQLTVYPDISENRFITEQISGTEDSGLLEINKT